MEKILQIPIDTVDFYYKYCPNHLQNGKIYIKYKKISLVYESEELLLHCTRTVPKFLNFWCIKI